jgi:hypothetical protein
MITILVIDDEADVGHTASDAIREAIDGVDCYNEVDFNNAANRIIELKPDAIVLDLMEGSHSANLPGQNTWQSVWEQSFFPIVIYTGWEGDLHPPVPPNHPFVKVVKKRSGSTKAVVEALKGFAPAMEAIRLLRKEVDAVIHRVLRDTAGAGATPVSDVAHLVHAGRRRIAASMDDRTLTGKRSLTSWEQYLVPAIGDSPMTADILRRRCADATDAQAYRLILTPSCDLVAGRCEKTLLTAKCVEGQMLVDVMSLNKKASKRDKSVEQCRKEALSGGVFNGYLPLPAYGNLIPSLLATLKDLEVIQYDCIGAGEDCEYVRVASIDSPFREQIVWAYLSTTGRPGVPDRDLNSWAEQLLNEASCDTEGVIKAGGSPDSQK